MTTENTFSLIKSNIAAVLPNAKIFLFGSRANGNAHEESDWDILILTKDRPDRQVKNKVHEVVFPISVNIAAHIDTVIVSETDWANNPGYYSLHRSVVSKNMIA